MSYIVLARKHRPQTFDEVVGQEHITDLLKKAIKADRLTHAYLFCGPRGIGKTSCARILAKSLNCEKGPTLKPCGKCSACVEIAKSTSFDVLEIDGASNNSVEEVRTLRENVKFAPSYGRYKIYIIDEVHMLSDAAFNALLKTLEEPPEHVKFIFATTAPQKVPATIISRCQRFDFKRISMKTIVELLSDVAKKEKVKIDQEALYAIGKAAQGSLRDGLSILDQLSALSEKGIDSKDVFSMLGLVETQFLFDLADALAAKDCMLSLQVLETIIDKGKDIKQLTRDITEHFRHLMVVKVGGKAMGKLVEYPIAIKDMLLEQSAKFTLKEILTCLDAFIEAQETARVVESARMPLEVAFAKLTYTGEHAPSTNPRDHKSDAESPRGFTPAKILRDNKGQVDITGSDPAPDESETHAPKVDGDRPLRIDEDHVEDLETLAAQELGHVKVEEKAEEVVLDLAKIKKAWDGLTHGVSRERMSLATCLQSSIPYGLKENVLTVGFPPERVFEKDTLQDQRNLELVEKIFSDLLKTQVVIRYEFIDDYVPQEETENVKGVLDTFGGKVVSRWHED